MKPILITFTALFVLCGELLFAQSVPFITQGTIEFEKSVNMHAIIKRSWGKTEEAYMQRSLDQYKKTWPQFRVLKSSLTFSKDKTLFTPIKEEGTPMPYSTDPTVAQNNIIYTDLAAKNSSTRKTVFEETFLVKDSIRNISWKITSETREIAGYSCRRANALILDSLYVVAFYTDQIPVRGGPESFTGLPGMILGLALPHENITWFATKVSPASVAPSSLVPPAQAKAKVVNNKELRTTLLSALKSWGDYAQRYLKAFFL